MGFTAEKQGAAGEQIRAHLPEESLSECLGRILSEDKLEQEDSQAGTGEDLQADVTGLCTVWILQGREGTQSLSPAEYRGENLCQCSHSTRRVRALL